MGLSYMGLNFFKEIAKMSLELLRLMLELLLAAASAAASPAGIQSRTFTGARSVCPRTP